MEGGPLNCYVKRGVDAVPLTSGIGRQGVLFQGALSLGLLGRKSKGREFIFVKHSLCHLNSPKKPRREDIVSVLKRRELRPPCG